MQTLRRRRSKRRVPIFIVGMPRTGTTLVERMLGSHSEVTSVGEAVDFPEEMSAARARRTRVLGLERPEPAACLAADGFRRGGSPLPGGRPPAGRRAALHDRQAAVQFPLLRPDPSGAAEGRHRASDARSDGYLLCGVQDAVHQRVPLLLSARRDRGVLHRLSPHDGSLALGHARRDPRRPLRRSGRRPGRRKCRRLLEHCGLRLGRSGARFSQLDESVHDSERDAGAQADLQVVRAEVAQLHTRAATGAAAAGRSRLVDADGNPLQPQPA